MDSIKRTLDISEFIYQKFHVTDSLTSATVLVKAIDASTIRVTEFQIFPRPWSWKSNTPM